MANILQLQLLQCEDLLFYSFFLMVNVICLEFGTVGWTKQDIWRCHSELGESVVDIFSEFYDIL